MVGNSHEIWYALQVIFALRAHIFARNLFFFLVKVTHSFQMHNVQKMPKHLNNLFEEMMTFKIFFNV